MLLLIGVSGSGKTRAAYEAVQAVVPLWWLFRPADLAELREFANAPTPRTVVWLDDITAFAGVDSAVLRRLLSGGCVVIATSWPPQYQQWTVLPPHGQPDTHARERGVLELATVMNLPATLSAAERDRADLIAPDDERIAAALRSTDADLVQTLAGGSELVRRWTSAPPIAHAVITAALDARRMGIEGPVTADMLRAAAAGYLPSTELVHLDEGLRAALEYATAAVRGGLGIFSPVGDGPGTLIGYHTADYLANHARRIRGPVGLPAEAWRSYSAFLLDAGDMFRAALAAQQRALFLHAENLLRAALLGGCSDAHAALVQFLQSLDRRDEAERVRWRGLNADGTTAA